MQWLKIGPQPQDGAGHQKVQLIIGLELSALPRLKARKGRVVGLGFGWRRSWRLSSAKTLGGKNKTKNLRNKVCWASGLVKRCWERALPGEDMQNPCFPHYPYLCAIELFHLAVLSCILFSNKCNQVFMSSSQVIINIELDEGCKVTRSDRSGVTWGIYSLIGVWRAERKSRLKKWAWGPCGQNDFGSEKEPLKRP